MDAIAQLFRSLNIQCEVFHNGQYCGQWAVDTSGTNYFSFHVVTYGKCYLHYAQTPEPIALEAGDWVLFPNDAKHAVSHSPAPPQQTNFAQSEPISDNLNPEGTGIICGYFSHQHPLMKSIVSHLPDCIVIKSSDQKNASVSQLMQVLLRESLTPEQHLGGNKALLEKLSEAIFAILLRDNFSAHQSVLAGYIHPVLAPVIRELHAHPEKKWSVQSMADVCFMSRAKFAALFKDITCLSPMDYLTQWRFVSAYADLRDSDISMLEVALKYGYDNEASFAKAFKRKVGMTPGSVRAA